MWHERRFRAMNTDCAVWVETGDARRANRALDAVEGFFVQVERRLSRFRPDSEVSKLNAERRIVPSRLLRGALEAAEAMREATGGLYNALAGAQVIAAGYDRTFEAIGSGAIRKGLAPPPTPVPAAGLVWDEHDGVGLPPDARLDLGGIAKGWVADRAAGFLALLGPCCVDAGGDIRVAGPWASGTGFLIEIDNPFEVGGSFESRLLSGGAIATSGIAKRWWTCGGELRHHLIDPRTGAPADSAALTVTVEAPTAVEAEAAAKAAFILGPEAGGAWLCERGYDGLFVMRDGALIRAI